MQDNHTLRGCKTPPSSGNLSKIVNPWNSLAACSALAHYKHLFEIALATTVQRMPGKKSGSISLKDLWQFVQNPCTHAAVFHIHPKQGNSSKTYIRQIPCRHHKTSQSPMVTQSPGRLLLRQLCPKLSGKVCLAGSLAGSLQSHRRFSEFHNICTDATLLVVSSFPSACKHERLPRTLLHQLRVHKAGGREVKHCGSTLWITAEIDSAMQEAISNVCLLPINQKLNCPQEQPAMSTVTLTSGTRTQIQVMLNCIHRFQAF